MEIVQQAFDAVQRRDESLWLSFCDLEIEDIPPAEWPESEPTRGPHALWDLYANNLEPWDDAAFQYADVVDAGDNRVLTRMTGKMRGRTSGAPVSWDLWQVVKLRDAKMLRIEWFAARSEALETLDWRSSGAIFILVVERLNGVGASRFC